MQSVFSVLCASERYPRLGTASLVQLYFAVVLSLVIQNHVAFIQSTLLRHVVVVLVVV